MEKINLTLGLRILLLGGCLIFGQLPASSVRAASQYFSPSSGNYAVGTSFKVDVYVASPNQAAGAFSATLNFPNDQLELESVSTEGSIIQFWVQAPKFSNTEGTVSFEGVLPNPGYLGSEGKLVTLVFKAIGDEPANLSFTKGVVLANDGLGTDITTGMGTAGFTLEPGVAGGVGPGLWYEDAAEKVIEVSRRLPTLVAGAQAVAVIGESEYSSESARNDRPASAQILSSLSGGTQLAILILLAGIFILSLIGVVFMALRLAYTHPRR